MYTYGAAEDKGIFELDKALMKTIPDGTPVNFSVGRYIAEGSEKNINKAKLFKSRILDIDEKAGSKEIDVYLTDALPDDWGSTDVRHYGCAYFNHAGWTCLLYTSPSTPDRG